VFTAPAIDASYRALATEYGDPAGVLTDNGAVFTGRYRGQGRVALEITLHARGVLFSHSRPYHPQTCGKVERFHQTQANWLAAQPRALTVPALQDQLDRFRGYSNDIRPHRALGRRTPADAYAARPKVTASGVPLIDGHFRVRHDKIDTNGKLTLRHNSRLHHIGLGRRRAGTPVLVPVHDLHIRVLSTSGRLLRDLTRDYQTTGLKRERCRETPVNGVPRHRTASAADGRWERADRHAFEVRLEPSTVVRWKGRAATPPCVFGAPDIDEEC
jgi:Integrase core domain